MPVLMETLWTIVGPSGTPIVCGCYRRADERLELIGHLQHVHRCACAFAAGAGCREREEPRQWMAGSCTRERFEEV